MSRCRLWAAAIALLMQLAVHGLSKKKGVTAYTRSMFFVLRRAILQAHSRIENALRVALFQSQR
jgi:hypothetical protein